MPATTPASYRLGSGTRTSSIPCAPPSCRRIGSRTSGADGIHGQNGIPQPLRELEMNASTLVICRDEIDPRRVRISGTNADHLVLFSDTIPLALLKEILARMEQDPEATVRLKAEGNLWRRSELS